MGKLRNEQEVLSRNAGLRYRAEYNASNQVIYEGWAINPAAAEGNNSWQIVKHTYNSSGDLTESNWANSSDNFSFSWTNRTTYSYT